MRSRSALCAIFFVAGCGRTLPAETEDASIDEASSCAPATVDTNGDAVPPWSVGIFHTRPTPGPNGAFNLRISATGTFTSESGGDAPCDAFDYEHGVARMIEDGGVELIPEADAATFDWQDSEGFEPATSITVTRADGGIVTSFDGKLLSWSPGTDCGCASYRACTCDPFYFSN